MDESKRLEILIKYGLDDEGARKALNDLDGLKKSTKGSTEETEKHNKHSREMMLLFRQLDRIVPGLGKALRAAFQPELLGVMGMIIAITALTKIFEAYRKKAEEAAEKASAVWQASRDAAEDAKKSYDDFQKTIENVIGLHAREAAAIEHKKALLEITLELYKQLPGYKESYGAIEKLKQQQDEIKAAEYNLARAKEKAQGLVVGETTGREGVAKAKSEMEKEDEKKLRSEAESAKQYIAQWKDVVDARTGKRTPELERALAAQQAAVDKFERYEANRATVMAQEKLIEQLKEARDEQAKATAELQKLNDNLLNERRKMQGQVLKETEKALGVSDVPHLIEKLYPQANARQQYMIAYNLLHTTDQTDYVLNAVVNFITTHQKQIDDMKKQLDRITR